MISLRRRDERGVHGEVAQGAVIDPVETGCLCRNVSVKPTFD